MIISNLNQKGGTAKTTSSLTFAWGAAAAGFKTCLIDLDPQANCADGFGVPTAPDLYHLLIDGQPLDKVAMQPRPVALPKLYLVRSDRTTAQVKALLMAADFREYALANALEGNHFDVIILDNAPSMDVLQTAALVASDYLIIPTLMKQFSIKGVMDAQTSLRAIARATNSHCKTIGILPTLFDRRENESHEQLKNLVDIYGGLVWPVIPTDSRVTVANRAGKSLYEYAPKSAALQGYPHNGKRIGGYNAALQRMLDYVE